MVMDIEQNANHTYEYILSEGKCDFMCRHTYTGMREVNVQMEEEFRHIRRVFAYSNRHTISVC